MELQRVLTRLVVAQEYPRGLLYLQKVQAEVAHAHRRVGLQLALTAKIEPHAV